MHKIGLVIVALIASVGIAQAAPTPPPQAVGVLHAANGTAIGNILFTQSPDGSTVFVSVAVKNLPAGTHGLTLRQVGNCTPFSAAGAAIPTDLPPLTVNADGTGEASLSTTSVSINSLLDANGSAVIVTAFQDENQKAACATLARVPVPQALPAGPTTLSAPFLTPTGANVGNVTMTQQADGMVRVQANVQGLLPGVHAMHVHQFGQCTPTFGAAGEHANPTNVGHGNAGPHAGDLPSITVNADGTGSFDGMTNQFTITPGDLTVRDTDGSAVIIHANPDDEVSQPGGKADGRIACAIVQPITVPLPDTGGSTPAWLLLTMFGAAAVAGGTLLRRQAQR